MADDVIVDGHVLANEESVEKNKASMRMREEQNSTVPICTHEFTNFAEEKYGRKK